MKISVILAHPIVISSEEQRKEWLQEVRQTVDKYFPRSAH